MQDQEEGEHHLTFSAHEGHQGELGHPAQAPDGQAGSLHADQDPEMHGECWPDDKVLKKQSILSRN